MSEKDFADLKAMGFTPGELVYSSRPCFTADDLNAMLNTRCSNPVTIPVRLNHFEQVQVVLCQVQVAFAESNSPVSGLKLKKHRGTPDWRFDGRIENKESLFYHRTVRGYVVNAGGVPCSVYIQVVPHNSDPNGEIIHADEDSSLLEAFDYDEEGDDWPEGL